MENSIVEIVAKYAEIQKDKACFIDEEGITTYGEIWKKIKCIAEKYRAMNIKKGDCVIVECTQNVKFIIAALACQLIEAIFIPIEKQSPVERVRSIWKDTDAKLLLSESKYDLPVDKAFIKDVFNDICKESKENFVFPKEEATAEILYTTGTTGKSKGIEITNKNNIALAENVKYGTEMKSDNVELIPLPLSHSHGLRCCYANLLNGSTIALVDGVTQIKCIFDWMDKYKITALDLSPSAVLILYKLSKGKISQFDSQLDYIQIGTAVLPEETKQLLISVFPTTRLYNFYGSTESGRTCVLNFAKDKDKKNSVGKPTKNAEFIVTDENRKTISSSKENMGLLATAGNMNMKGYWKNPELTLENMSDGYVYTNDLGYIDEEGYVYVLGRKDDVINCGGIKISPEEIEEIVIKNDLVIDCACIAKKHPVLGDAPILFIVIDEIKEYDKNLFGEWIRENIDANKLPKEIKVINQIPRTYNGKIQRKELYSVLLDNKEN